jgi:hypothetical protein
MPGLAQTVDSLNPCKGFFDLLALDCADAIAGMAGRARVDRGAAVGIVLRDMRRAAEFTAAGDKVGGVIVLVAAHSAAGFGIVLDRVERGSQASFSDAQRDRLLASAYACIGRFPPWPEVGLQASRAWHFLLILSS